MNSIEQANQYLSQGKLQQAEQLYRQILQANARSIDALWGLGRVALALDNYQVAHQIFTQCTSLVANHPELWLSLAQACQKLTQFEAAEQALLKAYQLNINYLPSLLALAIYYCESGEHEQADKYLSAIIEISAKHIQAFCLRVRINKEVITSEKSVEMLALLEGKYQESEALSEQEQILLHYAFAELYHIANNAECAFKHYQQANKQQHNMCQFSVNDMQSFFTELVDTFDHAVVNSPLKSSSATKVVQKKVIPIFIIGQPRSGSTLLEQMLIGHCAIESGGELPFLAGDIAQGVFQFTGKHFPQGCKQLTPEQCQQLADHYLMRLQELAPHSKMIIDKMPANYQSVALIKMLMPQAKVIHITRDPMDVSWSIYRNHFAATEPYFCNLTEIVNYHKNYQEVMTHWQNIMPDFIHTVAYQDLVDSPESEITKALSFCGLEYQKECLHFSDKKRYISTLSDVQLRSGIQQGLTKAWQPYEQNLSCLLQAFAETES